MKREPVMHRRGRLPRALAVLVAALVAVVLATAGCGGPSAIAPPGPQVGQRAKFVPPMSVSHTRLTDTSGHTFTLDSLAGKVVVISDMMTLCQEACPLDTANVVAGAREVAKAGLGRKVVFLSISIDPTRDTLTQLRAYRKLYGNPPSDWVVARPDPSQSATFWHALGVYIKRVPDGSPAPRNWRTGQPLTYDLTHSDEVFFFDGTGHERFLLEGVPHVAKGAPIPATINRFMTATGRRRVTHPDKLAWTLPQELDVVSWLTNHKIS